MLVRNLMALGKLCLILVCTNSYAQSWESPIFNNWSRADTLIGFTYNVSKFLTTQLKKEDRALHSQSVYHALNNLENGEMVEWFNDRTDAQGKAKIIYTFPANGNICRRVYSWVRLGAEEKNFEDTACYYNSTKTWKFIDKY